jgi:hypothetical protein
VAVGATCHEPEKGPDFTKTSQDGYTFDTWWEAQTLARNIISGHTQVRKQSTNRGKSTCRLAVVLLDGLLQCPGSHIILGHTQVRGIILYDKACRLALVLRDELWQCRQPHQLRTHSGTIKQAGSFLSRWWLSCLCSAV